MAYKDCRISEFCIRIEVLFNVAVEVEPSLGRRYPGGLLSADAAIVLQKLPVGTSFHITGVTGLTGDMPKAHKEEYLTTGKKLRLGWDNL